MVCHLLDIALMKKDSNATQGTWREGRRLRAWALAGQGWKQKDIAVALGVTPGAVSQWLKRAREGGSHALHSQPRPGRRPKLSPEQRAQIPALLERGPEAWRFRGHLWTRNRIRIVIQECFGVRYDLSQISRIMKQLRWSPQKPVRRARQRCEEVITHWREINGPALKKRPSSRTGRWYSSMKRAFTSYLRLDAPTHQWVLHQYCARR
jgi:transposase